MAPGEHPAYRKALRVANRSQHSRYKMAAVVWKSGRSLAVSCNGAVYGQHAELRALAKDVSLSGATLAIARIPSNNSKPCEACLAVIKKSKIRWVIYHDGKQVTRARPTQIKPKPTLPYIQ